MNGGNQYEGRVEICLNNHWGTVCDDYWKSNPHNARVACRQLGYSDIGKYLECMLPPGLHDFSQYYFTRGTLHMDRYQYIENTKCTLGSESLFSLQL